MGCIVSTSKKLADMHTYAVSVFRPSRPELVTNLAIELQVELGCKRFLSTGNVGTIKRASGK